MQAFTDTAGDATHAARVEHVVRQLRRHPADRPVSFRKKAPSHQVPKHGDRKYSDGKIDVSDLDRILAIDPEAMTATVEPGVTFHDLARATLAHGLVPIVVPELKTITVGGAVAGCSLESMSFKYGGFHDTCLEYEVITADGDVLQCRPDNEHRLIFEMIHGSFGTLGVLSKLTCRLVPAKPFVHVTYEHHPTLASYQAAIERYFREQSVDFVDGFIHSPTQYTLNVGRFVDAAPYANSYDWLKIYYESTARRREDYLKTLDYFFRYDHGVTDVFPRSFLGRLLFGKVTGSTTQLRLAERFHWLLPKERPTVTVDLFFPISRVTEFLDWYGREIDFYPLWVVPYRRVRDYPWIAGKFYDGLRDELFLDLAIYGLEQKDGRNVYKEFEDELQRVNGIKTLISHNYYDEETFWTIFNRENYEAVKRRTDPRRLFRDLYSKTHQRP